jgi:hypothetical protein
MPKQTLPRHGAFALCCLWVLSLGFTVNAADTDVVINEIMYHPPLELDQLQYIELFNRGPTSVDLSRWSFTKGVKFTFPDKTSLEPGAYLVICRNAATFSQTYGQQIPVLGDFSGKLGHHGEKLELFNARGQVVDEVKYSDRDPWPTGPDGHSASLERICPFVSGKDASNWAGSKLPAREGPAGTPGRRNDSFSTNLPPIISKVELKPPSPREKVPVTVEVADAAGVKGVSLFWRTARTGGQTQETEVPMQRIGGDEQKGTYQAAVEGQPEGTLVRFRVRAVNGPGASRLSPSPNDLRPSYSYSTFVNTNTARIAFGYVINVSRAETPSHDRFNRRPQATTYMSRGGSAFVYVPPDGGPVETFDYVHVRHRSGGFKVKFGSDHTFKGMTGINVIFENSPRWLLSEPMAYELYRLAGIPGELTEHLRTWVDGRLIGYQLLIEQPNKAFLSRNQRDESGNMYKVQWFGHGLVGQHVKKTHVTQGHDDLVALHRGLVQKSGAAQWDYIRKNFNVEELVNYYAVNMCIQNWDGFFNNYWLYHDTGRTGKWEMYPWDEDKTWGDYDGASPKYDWYEMPLTFGMTGDQSPRWNPLSRATFGGGPFGGAGWWRPPGWFSGPLLANPEFRRAFLERLEEICRTVFIEEKIEPLINAMERRLEPEIPVRASLTGQDPRELLREFRSDIQSLRNQVVNRRKFILAEIPKARAAQ